MSLSLKRAERQNINRKEYAKFISSFLIKLLRFFGRLRLISIQIRPNHKQQTTNLTYAYKTRVVQFKRREPFEKSKRTDKGRKCHEDHHPRQGRQRANEYPVNNWGGWTRICSCTCSSRRPCSTGW